MLTGGIDKVPEDFQDTYNFIDPSIEMMKSLNLNFMPNQIQDDLKTISEYKGSTLHDNLTTMTHPVPPINLSSSKTLTILKKAEVLSSEMSVLLNPKKHKSKIDLATESLKLVETDQREFVFDERRREQARIQKKWEDKKMVDKGYNQYLKKSSEFRGSEARKKATEKYYRMKVMDDIVLDY